jgi:hypothetical protein
MSTNSESRGATRSGRGKNQNPGTTAMAGPGTSTTQPGQASHPGKNRQTTPPQVPRGWGRYLVAAWPAGTLPTSAAVLEERGMPWMNIDPLTLPRLLAEDSQVVVLDEIPGADTTALPGRGPQPPACPTVIVVAMPPQHAAELSANPALVCEADAPLVCATANPLSAIIPAADPALAVPFAEPQTIVVRVHDRDGNPVPGAHVWALGTAFPAHARTDATGAAAVELVADTAETLRGVYVRPAYGFWPARVPASALSGFDSSELEVVVRSLSEPHAGFPTATLAGWGASALGMGKVPPAFRGNGVRVAILDSGVQADHPMLKHAVKDGADFTGGDSGSWGDDSTGRGTGCAGVIAAADTGSGTAGIASEAELFALKLFPHGRTSDLLTALDWCVEHGIDLAHLTLSCPPSRLIEWKLADVRAAGTAVIANAGDTGTVTAFPAAVPTVVAVGALAHPDTDPDTHMDGPAGRAIWSGPYTPAFTPMGADLAAPGTAIVTTAPGGEFTIADGTAIAAAHITGLAALLLAHHENLRAADDPSAGGGLSGAARVDMLTALLRAASSIPAGCDPARSGAGLPDAAVVQTTALSMAYSAGFPTTTVVGSP